MSSEYTPATEDVRQSYIREQSTDYEAYKVPTVIDGGTVDESQRGPAIRVKRDPEARRQAGPEFDRWHAEELRKARAAALRESSDWFWGREPETGEGNGRLYNSHQVGRTLGEWADQEEQG